MDRNIYLTIKNNTSTKDENDLYFPDVMTFPINRFIYTKPPESVTLDQYQIDRIDIYMSDYYGVSYYDDILLWLNNIKYKQDLEAGQKFLMADKEDLERFYLRYSV